MTTLMKNKHTAYVLSAWLVLMVLTAASWWVGADSQIPGSDRHLAMISILLLTFAKIYVVGHSFMELRESAPWLTRAFTTWCVALCALLIGMYLSI